MYLSRIHLNQRCKEVRRDLADPYQLHSTLCRAFCSPDQKCPPGEFLWRIESEGEATGTTHILLQSRSTPDWSGIVVKDWLSGADPFVDLKVRLNLDALEVGQRFRFRLRANPCVTRNGKRLGLLQQEDQESWLVRKGGLHGFSLSKLTSFGFSETSQARVDVCISQEQMLGGKQHSGNVIRIYSVLYDGILMVTEPDKFRNVIQTGIGHGKVMGLGLLSVVPIA